MTGVRHTGAPAPPRTPIAGARPGIMSAGVPRSRVGWLGLRLLGVRLLGVRLLGVRLLVVRLLSVVLGVVILGGCGLGAPSAGPDGRSGRPGSGAGSATSPGSAAGSGGAAGSASPAATGTAGRTTAGTNPATASPGSALAAAEALPVKGRAPLTGYARERFGQAWADADRNGCDTRNDVLRRDLRDVVLDPRTNGCVVLAGTLVDPYTGRTIAFVRGPGSSQAVQVDHVVALADAWQTGAQRWEPAKRVAVANDPLNLLAVDGPTNLAKGAGDAATWLPPRRSSWCAYVARQVAVKRKYALWVTPAERAAMLRVLGACPGQPLPTSGAPTLAPLDPGSAAEPWDGSGEAPPVAVAPSTAPSSAAGGAPSGLDPRFGSCREALAAGYGHYVLGVDPEYAWYVDGDGDGIVCE